VLVSEGVGVAVARLGVEAAFGLAGSGNFLMINAMRAAGTRYHGACHEAGAVAMADGYARVTGRVGVATVHQGPGVTNTITALTEAVRSRTPLVLLAPESSAGGKHANQALDQVPLIESVGAAATRLEDPVAAPDRVATAFQRAAAERRPVVLTLPVDQLERPFPGDAVGPPRLPTESPRAASDDALDALADAVMTARRPLIVAGRGAVTAGAGRALERVADRAGALLATTIVAKGMFAGDPFCVGFLGGLASPLATELAQQADLLVGFGTSLDAWTTCGGRVPGPGVDVAVVDDEPTALARHPRTSLALLGDAASTAEALAGRLEDRAARATWRTPELAARIAAYSRADEWRATASDLLDPHQLTIELNRLLPEDRIVALDSGHFLAFPSMHADSPDGRSFLFAQGFQSVGLGLGIGIGAAIGRGDRIVAAMIGDGGAKMSLLELDTAVRHALRLAVIVFDDCGYGAEVHDFEPFDVPVDIARFPSRDYAAIARALGAQGATVRSLEDLGALTTWLEAPDRPIVVDCKIDPAVNAAWAMTEAGAAEWSMAIPISTA
jgi:5-guanidino-2-oxopentanoate decarboxylase